MNTINRKNYWNCQFKYKITKIVIRIFQFPEYLENSIVSEQVSDERSL